MNSKDLHTLAFQDLDNDEDSTVLVFKAKYHLERGWYKKSLQFFYWLYKKENGNVTEKEFGKSFIGRMVKFDKRNIPNYTELVFEYEKEKRAEKIRLFQAKKRKLTGVPTTPKRKDNKSKEGSD